jgi:hypothetical protein
LEFDAWNLGFQRLRERSREGGGFMPIKAFWVICVRGFLAAYAHLVFALLADRLGMARLDYGDGLSTLLFSESYAANRPISLALRLSI